MNKFVIAAATSFLFILGMSPFVAGSPEPSTAACTGEWCDVNTPGGTVQLCCGVGHCPDPNGGEVKCVGESD